MLFLAVTLGFFVENQREHFIEHQREKKYIRSMIEDLKTDTSSFRLAMETNIKSCNELDTLIRLLKRKDRKLFAKRIYYLARFIPFEDPYLNCQDKTYEQMKSSGSFRLIRDEKVLNRISTYYQINTYIESGPTPMQFQNRRDFMLGVDQLFDIAVFQEMVREWGLRNEMIPEDRFVLLSDDEKLINSVCARYHFMYSTKKIVFGAARNFIGQANELMKHLQTEYNID